MKDNLILLAAEQGYRESIKRITDEAVRFLIKNCYTIITVGTLASFLLGFIFGIVTYGERSRAGMILSGIFKGFIVMILYGIAVVILQAFPLAVMILIGVMIFSIIALMLLKIIKG